MNCYTCEGSLVISEPCGLHSVHTWPQWSLHRGEFHMMLLRIFKERAREDKVIADVALVHFIGAESGKTNVRFEHKKGVVYQM